MKASILLTVTLVYMAVVIQARAPLIMLPGKPCDQGDIVYAPGERMPTPSDMPCYVCYCSTTGGRVCMKEDCSLTGDA